MNDEIRAQADYSRFVRRVRRRYAKELSLLTAGTPDVCKMQSTVEQLQTQGYPIAAALRIMRQLVIERLAVLDIEHELPLLSVMQCMSDLAEYSLQTALALAEKELDAQYGAPLCKDGSRCSFWIVGMGKLGGRELNVSSDVDLVYVYEEAGQTQGGQLSNHEYFGLLAKRLYTLIGETTEHGFVFRVDLALKPNGNSGPIATSLAMLKTYFHLQGRDWERFAWMKGRTVASSERDTCKQKESRLKQIVRSFVYRNYLDFNLLESLRDIHQKIRQQAVEAAINNPGRSNDVKLSRGGIRELEFTIQLFQVVRGGQYPEIRTNSTLQGLERLKHAGLLTEKNTEQLRTAYQFLRQVEHRIQYLDDQQTHQLPSDKADLKWIALGLSSDKTVDCLTELRERLQTSKTVIEKQFDGLLFLSDETTATNPCSSGQCARSDKVLGDKGFEELLPLGIRERVQYWAQSKRVGELQPRTKINLSHLILRTAEWLDESMTSEVAALRFLDWLDTILRRENYHALLLERPIIHQRLLRVLGRARWAALYLRRYPSVVDELGGRELYEGRFNAQGYEQELLLRRSALQSSAEDDEENLLDVLRRAHHSELFRTLVRDIEERLSVEQVADDLSALADVTLKIAMLWSWDFLNQRHKGTPSMGILAYGKLGGIELGYGGDLDIVFVYDDTYEQAAEVYGAHIRKMIQWLTLKTAEGDLFEIDTGLRPNGNAGLLVTSIEAFEAYQLGRGSNPAWTWEHQAITRARCAVGHKDLAQRFDAVRHQVITVKRDRVALKEEILAMRERISQSHPLANGKVDVKYSSGGMLDIEFCVQYLVLAYAWQHPELEDDVGNIALLNRAQAVKVITAPYGEQAANSYRLLRQIQHRQRLEEQSLELGDEVAAACEAGIRLWRHIFVK